MARKFTSNGTEYSDTPAGWLKAAKDDWNAKLTAAGHRMTWRKNGKNSYGGDCRDCGGNVEIGSMDSSSHGPDIRHTPCRELTEITRVQEKIRTMTPEEFQEWLLAGARYIAAEHAKFEALLADLEGTTQRHQ
jgi:hypothetical protein